jgi:hypothetical protein
MCLIADIEKFLSVLDWQDWCLPLNEVVRITWYMFSANLPKRIYYHVWCTIMHFLSLLLTCSIRRNTDCIPWNSPTPNYTQVFDSWCFYVGYWKTVFNDSSVLKWHEWSESHSVAILCDFPWKWPPQIKGFWIGESEKIVSSYFILLMCYHVSQHQGVKPSKCFWFYHIRRLPHVVFLPGFQKGRAQFRPKKAICVVARNITPFRVNKMFSQ